MLTVVIIKAMIQIASILVTPQTARTLQEHDIESADVRDHLEMLSAGEYTQQQLYDALCDSRDPSRRNEWREYVEAVYTASRTVGRAQ